MKNVIYLDSLSFKDFYYKLKTRSRDHARQYVIPYSSKADARTFNLEAIRAYKELYNMGVLVDERVDASEFDDVESR